MTEIGTIVKNAAGLHARPAAQLVNLCKTFKSNISLRAGDRSCDAKSIFKVLQCCIKIGESVVIRADGEDEISAAQAVAVLIEQLEE